MTTTAQPSKITFIVVDENVLCSVFPQQPLTGQILASSIINGATVSWMDGLMSLPLDPAWVRSADCPKPLDLAAAGAGKVSVRLDPARVRPAKRSDFDRFRLSTGGYETCPHHAFPAE